MDRRIRISVSRSSDTPSSARYSHWIGTRTESLAARAFSVSRSRAGGQSIRMNSYFSGILLQDRLEPKFAVLHGDELNCRADEILVRRNQIKAFDLGLQNYSIDRLFRMRG